MPARPDTASPSIDRSSSGIELRVAWPDEIERARRLFRIPFPADRRLEVMVAVRRDRLLACVAICPLAMPDGAMEGRFSWSVRAADDATVLELLRAAITHVGGRGYRSLAHQGMLDDADSAAATLRVLGFEVRETIDEYECDFAAVLERSRRVFSHLQRTRRAPADVCVRALAPDLVPAARAQLHAAGIMDTLEFDDRCSGRHQQPIDRQASTAITVAGELIAVMLIAASADPTVCLVPARWVALPYRNGFANAALIQRSAECVNHPGLKLARFVANSAVHDETVRLARRLGGRRARSRERYALALPDA